MGEAVVYDGSFRADLAELLDRMLAGAPGLRRGKMFGLPAYYAGPKMFACVFGPGLALKPPPDQAGALLARPGVTPFSPRGRRMGGWVLITHAETAAYAAEQDLLLAAAAYVAGIAGDA